MYVTGDSDADFNPHLASCRACQPDPAWHRSWRVITMCWVWLLPSQIRVVMAVRSRGGAPAEPTGSSGALEHAVAYRLRHQGCAGNGPF
jgi:hypothetical protein